MIELRNVHKKFGRHVVLDGVDFTVNDGETVALLGPSGTGKSVLLKHIIGLMRPASSNPVITGPSSRMMLSAMTAPSRYSGMLPVNW